MKNAVLDLTMLYTILLFAAFQKYAYSVMLYRNRMRGAAPDPPRGAPGGELPKKTLDLEAPQLPTGRVPRILDFDPTPLP